MNDVVIKVENLGKQYRIGAQQARYATLRDAIVASFRSLSPSHRSESGGNGTIWALKDVSFEVRQGEVVGIIGRNGAGKSTLLKELSHITEPTEGRVHLRGRVGSLLEVGTGFHAELTGRENIYLNGAILGMKRAEIERKFDEIVAFAEIEKFLDTPVKHYSSGMYVRLAFAVAAHLEPEILLVDEVLAVGDAAFQKKCIGRMGEVAQEGRTVLFVSHNMGAVESLCPRTMLLDGGEVLADGESRPVVSKYMTRHTAVARDPFEDCSRSGDGRIRITGFRVESTDSLQLARLKSGEPFVAVISYRRNGDSLGSVSVGMSVHTDTEFGLFLNYSHFSDVSFTDVPPTGEFRCRIEDCPLAPGNYLVMLRIISGGQEIDWPKVYVPFTVVMSDFYGVGGFDGRLASWGPILVRGAWSVRAAESDPLQQKVQQP